MSTDRTSHLERTAQEPRGDKLHDVSLSRVDEVNERVRLLRLSLISGPIKFLPGQWLDTFVPGVPRAGGFTISSPPSAASVSNSPYLELAIQQSPDNPPAAWLWRHKNEILDSTLQVRVGGSFTFPPVGMTLEQIRRVVFVAGGVGINPLMSMLSYLSEVGSGMDVQLLYASKVAEGGVGEILFVRRIARLLEQGKLSGRFQLFLTGLQHDEKVLNTEDELKVLLERARTDIHTRRITPEDIARAVGMDGRNSTLTYICGPPAMTDDLVEVLTSPDGIGLERRQVLTEKWW